MSPLTVSNATAFVFKSSDAPPEATWVTSKCFPPGSFFGFIIDFSDDSVLLIHEVIMDLFQFPAWQTSPEVKRWTDLLPTYIFGGVNRHPRCAHITLGSHLKGHMGNKTFDHFSKHFKCTSATRQPSCVCLKKILNLSRLNSRCKNISLILESITKHRGLWETSEQTLLGFVWLWDRRNAFQKQHAIIMPSSENRCTNKRKTLCTAFHTNSCKTLTYQHSIIQNALKNISMNRCACWPQCYVHLSVIWWGLTWTQSNVRRDWLAWWARSSPPNACSVSFSFPTPQPCSPEAGPVWTAPNSACFLQPPHWETQRQKF